MIAMNQNQTPLLLTPCSGFDLCLRFFQDLHFTTPNDSVVISMVKTSIRMLSLPVCVPFLVSFTMFYNAMGALVKTPLALLCWATKIKIFEGNGQDYWKDIKKHLFYVIYDFAAKVLSSFITLFYMFVPERIHHVHKIFIKEVEGV